MQDPEGSNGGIAPKYSFRQHLSRDKERHQQTKLLLPRSERISSILSLILTSDALIIRVWGSVASGQLSYQRRKMDDPKKVVLAEDNADNRELIRWMLESADLSIELVEAENGEEALRLVMELKPSLVLMDMSMPVLDGWEATKRIRATKEIANIPIIGLTAHAREEDKQRVLAIGCNEYVAKPINSDDFIEKVRRYLS